MGRGRGRPSLLIKCLNYKRKDVVCGLVTYLASHLSFQGGKGILFLLSSNVVLLIFHITLACFRFLCISTCTSDKVGKNTRLSHLTRLF